MPADVSSAAHPPCVGVDLGGSSIQAGVLDGDDRIIASHTAETAAHEGEQAVLDRIEAAVDRVLSEAGLERRELAGIGVGAPGALDIPRGIVLKAVNLRWRDMPLAQRLGERFSLPVTLDNDVNVAAWGEHELGAGRDQGDMLAVFVGTGVGAGLVLNGRIYHGHHFTAGEIGHTVVDADAKLGRRTLENLASRTSVTHQLVQLALADHATNVRELTEQPPRQIRANVLARGMQENDPLVCEVLRDAAGYLGTSIANMVTMLSLPCVIVGGGLAEALGEPWLEMVRSAFARDVFPAQLQTCQLLPASLGDHAGITGAALLARQSNN